jgi:hypothetical protein
MEIDNAKGTKSKDLVVKLQVALTSQLKPVVVGL